MNSETTIERQPVDFQRKLVSPDASVCMCDLLQQTAHAAHGPSCSVTFPMHEEQHQDSADMPPHFFDDTEAPHARWCERSCCDPKNMFDGNINSSKVDNLSLAVGQPLKLIRVWTPPHSIGARHARHFQPLALPGFQPVALTAIGSWASFPSII